MKIIKQYNSDGNIVTEYSKDGTLVTHIVKVPIETDLIEPQPSEMELTQAKILLNTEMLLIYKEIEMEMEMI